MFAHYQTFWEPRPHDYKDLEIFVLLLSLNPFYFNTTTKSTKTKRNKCMLENENIVDFQILRLSVKRTQSGENMFKGI